MAKIIIQQSENGISVKSGSLLNRFYRVGELQAAAGSVSGRVTITDTVDGSYVCFEQPYQDIVDNTDTAWGTTQANTVSNLNDVINATPKVFIKDSDNITKLSGIVESDFTSKPGYGVFVGQNDGSLTTSDAINLVTIVNKGLSYTDLQLGVPFNTNNFNITSPSGNHIKFFPGTGGNVGIGTNSPSEKLTVRSGTIKIDDGSNPYTLPTSDGSNGQVIRTNGSGTLSFVDRFDVEGNSIFTSTSNGDIQITPNGTGSVNLDGTVKFKRFDPSSAPDAFVGGMYADTNDDLYFGVEESE